MPSWGVGWLARQAEGSRPRATRDPAPPGPHSLAALLWGEAPQPSPSPSDSAPTGSAVCTLVYNISNHNCRRQRDPLKGQGEREEPAGLCSDTHQHHAAEGWASRGDTDIGGGGGPCHHALFVGGQEGALGDPWAPPTSPQAHPLVSWLQIKVPEKLSPEGRGSWCSLGVLLSPSPPGHPRSLSFLVHPNQGPEGSPAQNAAPPALPIYILGRNEPRAWTGAPTFHPQGKEGWKCPHPRPWSR